MAQTFTTLLVHVVFSTKQRANLIAPTIEPKLYAYLKGIAENLESPILAAGGTENHVHLLISQSKNVALSGLMETIKKESSKWIKLQSPKFRRFYWQDGYGAFSIGESGVEALKRYIARQKEHHRRLSFEAEYLKILKKYRIEYDERYIWK